MNATLLWLIAAIVTALIAAGGLVLLIIGLIRRPAQRGLAVVGLVLMLLGGAGTIMAGLTWMSHSREDVSDWVESEWERTRQDPASFTMPEEHHD